jgi:hypothetical protein
MTPLPNLLYIEVLEHVCSRMSHVAFFFALLCTRLELKEEGGGGVYFHC